MSRAWFWRTRSSQEGWSGLKIAAWLTSRQNAARAARAPSAPPSAHAVGEHGRVHGAGAGGADPLEAQTSIIQEAIKHAPGEGAVGTTALKGKVQDLVRFDVPS